MVGRSQARERIGGRRVSTTSPRRPASPLLVNAALAVLFVSTIAVGVYLRLAPLFSTISYGYHPYLDELDPYEAYYVVNYLLQHGPLSYLDLRPPNPAVMIFWHPWGRDFLTSELPGLIYTIYITYLPLKALGVDLMSYMVVFPAIAAAVALVGIYLVARELSGNRLTAIISMAFFAFSFSDRTIAGFTVKYTMAILILPFALYTFVKAYKSMRPLYFALHGILVAYMAISSGLYIGVLGTSAATMLLYPFIARKVERRILLINTILMTAPSLTVFALYPLYGIEYIYKGLGIVALAPTAAVLLRYYLLPTLFGRRERLSSYAYLGVIASAAASILALMATGKIVGGKVAQALGVTHVLGVLSFTVAEYQPINAGMLMTYYGVPVIVSVLSILYGLYLLIARRDLVALYVSVLTIATLYVLDNLSYFLSLATEILAISSAYFLGLLASTAWRSMTQGRRRALTISPILSIMLLLTIIASQAYVVNAYHIGGYRYHLPMILTSGIGTSSPNDAWLQALHWIRSNTSEDSVIVSWWDYGYWISVLGGRASVADGATINGTQISLLAKILTSPEDVAARMLSDHLGLKPGKTYVLVYDTFVATGSYVYPLNNADAAKAVSAIMRIAGIDLDSDLYGNNPRTPQYLGYGPQKYVTLVRDPRGNPVALAPNWGSQSVENMLLFRIMINGIYQAFPGSVLYSTDPSYGGSPVAMNVSDRIMNFFAPAAIFKSAIQSIPGYYSVYVIVFVYEMTQIPTAVNATRQ